MAVSQKSAVPLFEWIRRSDRARRSVGGEGAGVAKEWWWAARPFWRAGGEVSGYSEAERRRRPNGVKCMRP